MVGEVTPAAARDFGLAPGTAVAAGCGDTAACALGAGAVVPGMVFDSAGTAAVLAACTDQFVADRKHRALLCMHSVIPGVYNPLAYIAGGGIALRWFRDQFYNTLRGAEQPREGDLYEAMIAWAETIPPGADGLFFSPHLGGRICPSAPAMRGAWIGFSWGHSQAHFCRALLESIAYEYAFYLGILKDQLPGLALVEARAVGGGARSAAWNQIKADVLDLPYQSLGRSELGTWGAALIAGKAVGLFDDLAAVAVAAAQPVGQPLAPRPELRGTYDKLAAQYIALQETLHGYFEGGNRNACHCERVIQCHSVRQTASEAISCGTKEIASLLSCRHECCVSGPAPRNDGERGGAGVYTTTRNSLATRFCKLLSRVRERGVRILHLQGHGRACDA